MLGAGGATARDAHLSRAALKADALVRHRQLNRLPLPVRADQLARLGGPHPNLQQMRASPRGAVRPAAAGADSAAGAARAAVGDAGAEGLRPPPGLLAVQALAASRHT